MKHKSVLLYESVEGLNIKKDGIYVDATLGYGGHSLEILKRINEGFLFAFDQDSEAIEYSRERLKKYDNYKIIKSNFANMKECMHEMGVYKVDGILFDIGVSSMQLDEDYRGFSYHNDARLDMRMDTDSSFSAYELVNQYSYQELVRVLRDYGEEKFAKNIARHIVARRQEKPIETTEELNDIIKAAIPAKVRATGGHPSKRTYQAIRIELNHELEVLNNSLDDMIDLLLPGGRLCVITFHSLEDRMVKTIFKRNENPCTCPPNFPVCTCGKKSKGSMITRKPVVPGDQELEENPRSKSSKLRVFEKIKE